MKCAILAVYVCLRLSLGQDSILQKAEFKALYIASSLGKVVLLLGCSSLSLSLRSIINERILNSPSACFVNLHFMVLLVIRCTNECR